MHLQGLARNPGITPIFLQEWVWEVVSYLRWTLGDSTFFVISTTEHVHIEPVHLENCDVIEQGRHTVSLVGRLVVKGSLPDRLDIAERTSTGLFKRPQRIPDLKGDSWERFYAEQCHFAVIYLKGYSLKPRDRLLTVLHPAITEQQLRVDNAHFRNRTERHLQGGVP